MQAIILLVLFLLAGVKVLVEHMKEDITAYVEANAAEAFINMGRVESEPVGIVIALCLLFIYPCAARPPSLCLPYSSTERLRSREVLSSCSCGGVLNCSSMIPGTSRRY